MPVNSQSDNEPVFHVASMGDSAIHLTIGAEISVAINQKIMTLLSKIQEQNWVGIRELVPSYNTLVIHFDPFAINHEEIRSRLAVLIKGQLSIEQRAGKLVVIPTCYGGGFGPDLESVSELTGISSNAVIEMHCGTDYRVYALGFSPGFPYLGGMDDRLFCPRLESPRVEVPGGSVAIAETQTGIYPSSSPGGWRLIGKTPITLFDPYRNPPCFYRPGDYIRFVPISSEQFVQIKDDVNCGRYKVEIIDID